MNVPHEKLPATRNTATAAASSAKAAKIIRRTLRIGNDLFLMGHMIIHHYKEQRHIHTMGSYSWRALFKTAARSEASNEDNLFAKSG